MLLLTIATVILAGLSFWAAVYYGRRATDLLAFRASPVVECRGADRLTAASPAVTAPQRDLWPTPRIILRHNPRTRRHG